MSWLFSRVLVEEFSEAICSDGEQSAPLSGSPIPQAFCAPDKMKAFSRVSRFGMTFGPLTEDRGEELLTWFRGAFPVKTFPQPEKVQGSTESEAECGPKWRGSFAKYDPDSCSWKTHQCSLLGGLTEYSETWPRWGSMRNGECWERPMLAHLTNETEFGLWPTPDANCGMRGTTETWMPTRPSGQPAQYSINQAVRDREGVGGSLNPTWVEWLMGWPLGWTDLKPLETDKFQKWLDEHSNN